MTTLLTGGTVWDGLADCPAGVRDILIADGKIKRIGERIDAPEGCAVADLTGHTVTPGFIDSHTHVTVWPSLGDILQESAAAVALRSLPVLRTLLFNGFTTVRDLMTADAGFNTVDLRNAIAAGLIVGPRMIVAPHLISARGGHGDQSAALAAQYQGSPKFLELAAADGVPEIRTRVRQEVRAGADWIKFGATGGFSTPSDDPGQTTYSQEEMDVLVATAADLGRWTTPHCYGDEGVKRAVRAGVRSIEHGNLASKEALKMIEDNGVFLVPTLYTVLDDARYAFDDDRWKDKPVYKRRKFQTYQRALLAATEHLAGGEIKLVFGSDCGMFPHGDNWREFPTMISAGITPVRALRAATSVAAEMLGQDDIGVLAEGKTADVIAMPGDPFTDITITGQVDFVMQAGTIHKRPGQYGPNQ